MRIILLLSSLLSFLFSFSELFHYNIKNFDVIQTDKSYKLILKNQQFFDYSSKGFKFFLPKFTKEFNLKILRFNSTGFISGYLSMDKTFSKPLNISPNEDLQYYITDYKSTGRELNYLLKGYSIPYKDVTSISLEAYNIPPKIYNKLNKFLYFKIDHSKDKNNKLKYLAYSFYIILDKPKLDQFLKYSKMSFKNFINNIYKLNPKSVISTKKSKKKKITKSVPYALKLHLFLYMKEYGFIPQEKKYKIKTDFNQNKILNLYSKLEDLKYKIKDYFYSSFVINAKDKTDKILDKLDNISTSLSNIECNAKLIKPKCIDYNTNDKKCFHNPVFFHNYLYFKLKENQIPNIEEILAYGDYKTFNDIGKYYFEIGEFKKAEIFLQKAYALQKDPIIIHNLFVLYIHYNPVWDLQKAIFYLKQSTLPVDYYNLGVLYYIGKGVKENNFLARKYFLKANTIPYAQKNIEIMKQYKLGVK